MTPEKAQVRLEEQCARAEVSTGEAMEKLRRWGISQQEATTIIRKLTDTRYIDDRRYAAAYVNDKIAFARWGKRKIAHALHMKGVSRDIAAPILDNVDEETYEDNIRHIITVKTQSNPALTGTYEGRTKLFRHLLSRGYEADTAARVLKAMISESGNL